ncbi:MAG: monovalent cation/H(+) antiporter subunit G [Ectothiorhodospiraceae bacterium]|nr:monovalent cation/H(+) antiporter subunit G [Ectothiorhodospiraceae bacterium]MCH8505194.1 monovalent cation/H(+) antiporter subunit G [Ectothiorhodospiraceae bacterium]
MSEVMSAFFLLVGAGFVLIGALGVIRMPDLMLRMHTTTKAGALGGGLIAIGAGLFFADASIMVRAVAILAFVVLTAPIAAHIIGRAAYFVGVPLWERTVTDELRECLDTEKHTLHSTKLKSDRSE